MMATRRAKAGVGGAVRNMKSIFLAVPLYFAALLTVSAVHAAAVEVPLPVALDPKIESILAPLSGIPVLQTAREPLLVEVDPAAAGDRAQARAWLTPSFGALRPRLALGAPRAVQVGVPSRLWPGRTVDRFEYTLPADLLPDLYDLEVALPGASPLGRLRDTDLQRRAVSILREYPKAPRVVVLADPSVGDPRPLQDAATDAVSRGEVAQLLQVVQRSIGNPMNSERWAALNRAIQEINLVRPDFVLVTGDLTFLAYPQALPYEYEDIWNLLDRLQVPVFVSPGNHDLYVMDDYAGGTTALWDGTALWRQYFGPLHYSVGIGPNLHLASLNTFEWPSLTPFPPEEEFDTRAAGHLLPEQLAWLENDLRAYRERSPDGLLLTMAHHDPSWMQRRHAWTGEGRLELRELCARYQVGAHFSGHTHEDRVARYYKGDVVETNGRPHVDGHVVRQLHLLKTDGSLDAAPTQEALGKILREPEHGPLFVSTTTTSSQLVGDIWGLGGYWGWRLAHLIPRDNRGGFDPIDFGYPATDEFLAARAERPENWTAEHAQYGLFSYPSFELDQQHVSDSQLRIDSRLLADVGVTARLRIAAAEGAPLSAQGGEILQVRYGEGLAEAWVAAMVPAQGGLDVSVTTTVSDQPALQKVTAKFGGAMSTGFVWIVVPLQLLRRVLKFAIRPFLGLPARCYLN